MTLKHLQNSCKRLPELIEIGAPSSLITSEFQLLTSHAFVLLRESQAREYEEQLARRRKGKEKTE